MEYLEVMQYWGRVGNQEATNVASARGQEELTVIKHMRFITLKEVELGIASTVTTGPKLAIA